MDEVIERIFTVNLGVRKNEKVLVFTDLINPAEDVSADEEKRRDSLREIAIEVAETGKEYCDTSYLEFPSVMGHGKEPPKAVWEAAYGKKAVDELVEQKLLERIIAKEASADELKKAEDIIARHGKMPGAIIALSNYSTSHTRFRDFLTRVGGVRYASMPLFESSMLSGVMTADWNEVAARTLNVVKKMSGANTVVITSHNGTSISFSIEGREVQPDTGILTKRGSFGNLPAGEAFLAPVEGTAEGTLILEWAPTKKLASPIELTVRKGRVVEVSGKDPFAHDLKEKIMANPLFGNIAELGIGTNDKAVRPDNILETEKILGTVHIALGDNSSFGGKVSVPFHQDFIFFKPTLEAIRGEEKIEIIINGETKF